MKTKVWLGSSTVGDPPKRQFFSLIYKNEEGVDVYADLSGLRPDPRDYLEGDKKYDAVLFFDDLKDLRKILVKGTPFENESLTSRTFIMIR
jgi:hypothetical protein